MKTRTTGQRRERKTKIINFRIGASAEAELSTLMKEMPGITSADQAARSILLGALADRHACGHARRFAPKKLVSFEIMVGDARKMVAALPSRCVHACICSPPYWRKLDYRHPLQIGWERSPEGYIESLAAVFAEVSRVLRPDGSLWINIDDRYDDKVLLGIPWRLALALQKQGWVLRADVIWHKPSILPEGGAKDRVSRNHEYLFHFTQRKQDYYFDLDAIREPHSPWALDCIAKAQRSGTKRRADYNVFSKQERHANGQQGVSRADYGTLMHPLGRQKRSVWTVNTNKFKGEHYATYPEELVEPCILSTVPKGGIVLDPFCGSGTTGVAALKLARRFLGIDLLPRYAQMAMDRLEKLAQHR